MKKINLKSIKNFTIGFLVGVSLLATGSAYANTNTIEKIQAYLNYDVNVVYNSKNVALSNPPITYNGKTYLPLTDVGKLTNTSVKWNQKERSVEMTSNKQDIEVLEDYYSSGSEDIAIKIDDTVFVTLASGSRQYGLFNDISYTQKTKTVSFKDSDKIIVSSDVVSSDVEAFTYQGIVFIKESILKELSKAPL
jgi:hypothetical protein